MGYGTWPCRACKAPMTPAIMPTGKTNPLNVAEVEPDVGKGIYAYNPRTEHAVPVTPANIEACPAWAAAGVTYHTSHFSDCPERQKFKRRETPDA